MYRKEPKKLIFPEFIEFNMPFGGKLRADNRWITKSKIIPWDFIEDEYGKKFSKMKIGAPAKKGRVAFGALYIKDQLRISDEELVLQIRENPYLQYFLGYEKFDDRKPFDSSLMVYFRRRFTPEMLSKINDVMLTRESKKKSNDENSNDPPSGNKGKLLIDSTCIPADIKYPTDLNLLNEAREKIEGIIDHLHEPLKGKEKKVRTYRRCARRDYLRTAKKRKVSGKALRKSIGKQLRYLSRNLGHIDKLLKKSEVSLLTNKQSKDLLVINELYRQQQEMYDKKINSVKDRIVSISQPHIRPIVRGKAGKSTEFGAKISLSYVDGFVYLDRLSWDNYNECHDLFNQVELYKKRFGYYPKEIHADKIYRNRVNRSLCKSLGISLSGPPLGRPRKNIQEKIKHKEGERNPIEGKFGEGKRRYSLNRIMGKLPETSGSMIAMITLIMNINRLYRDLILYAKKLLVIFQTKKTKFA